MKNGSRILVFTGDGKGKTTAAVGMAVRAAGHGFPVLLVQFIKADDSTGELLALTRLGGVNVRQLGLGFLPKRDSPTFGRHREAAERGLAETQDAMASGRYRLVVLDEVCTAVAEGLLAELSVIEAVKSASPQCIVVLTGRGAGPGLVDLADTVTEMRCIRHGYQQGVKAQPGVEY